MEEKTSVTTPQENQGMSYETKTIIVILCLLFLTPIGLILMWVWMKWPLWVRILLTVLPFLFAFAVAGFVAWVLTMVFSNPDVQKQMREQIQQQQNVQLSQMPSQNNAENLKTYTSTYGYSFSYPSNFTLEEADPKEFGNVITGQYLLSEKTSKKISIMLSNWTIEHQKSFLNYGEAGNKAEATIMTEMFKGKEIIKAVITTSQINYETNKYDESSTKLYRILIPLGNNTLAIEGLITQKDTIDNILNSLLFTTSSEQLSSEGQSCGPNAGAAGDAQCAAGLTCVYKTPEEKTQGIGSCTTQ